MRWGCASEAGGGVRCRGGELTKRQMEGVGEWGATHCAAARRTRSSGCGAGQWYSREVRRSAWIMGAGRMSLRRTAEFRAVAGAKERWRMWRPWMRAAGDPVIGGSTVQRWLDRAGVAAQAAYQSIAGHAQSTELGTDGLWAGCGAVPPGWCCCWPTASPGCYGRRWSRAGRPGGALATPLRAGRQAGLAGTLRGVTSDGAQGLSAFWARPWLGAAPALRVAPLAQLGEWRTRRDVLAKRYGSRCGASWWR